MASALEGDCHRKDCHQQDLNGKAYLEQPISLASHWCCTNSCREASLLGGDPEYWGLMVEAMALLM